VDLCWVVYTDSIAQVLFCFSITRPSASTHKPQLLHRLKIKFMYKNFKSNYIELFTYLSTRDFLFLSLLDLLIDFLKLPLCLVRYGGWTLFLALFLLSKLFTLPLCNFRYLCYMYRSAYSAGTHQ
jgi:hypothetical protein